MKRIVVLVIAALAYVAGYLTHGAAPDLVVRIPAPKAPAELVRPDRTPAAVAYGDNSFANTGNDNVIVFGGKI